MKKKNKKKTALYCFSFCLLATSYIYNTFRREISKNSSSCFCSSVNLSMPAAAAVDFLESFFFCCFWVANKDESNAVATPPPPPPPPPAAANDDDDDDDDDFDDDVPPPIFDSSNPEKKATPLAAEDDDDIGTGDDDDDDAATRNGLMEDEDDEEDDCAEACAAFAILVHAFNSSVAFLLTSGADVTYFSLMSLTVLPSFVSLIRVSVIFNEESRSKTSATPSVESALNDFSSALFNDINSSFNRELIAFVQINRIKTLRSVLCWALLMRYLMCQEDLPAVPGNDSRVLYR